MAQDMTPDRGAGSALHGRSLQGMAVLGGAVLLGSTFLSTPVTAQTVDELKAQIAELSQRVDELEVQSVATPVIAPAQAVTAGDFPGSITLPGTNTSFKVGGYVKMDMHWTSVQGMSILMLSNCLSSLSPRLNMRVGAPPHPCSRDRDYV